MKYLLKLLLILFLILFFGRAQGQDLEDLINNSSNPEAFWSVTVLNEKGDILESINSDKLIIPASNQKLYTLGAVLDRLGSDFRYTTNIYGDGKLIDSTWQGDMIIKGSGDPSISGLLYEGDRHYVFKSFLQQLRGAGIGSLNGKLVANIGMFYWQKFPVGWDWYDLTFYYGVEIAPLSFNNNAIDLIVKADGDLGSKPNIEWFPNNTDYVTIYNSQTIIEPERKYDEDYKKYLGQNRFHLGSKLPQGYLEKESLAITNAEDYFLDSFNLFLNKSDFKTLSKFSTQNGDIPNYWKVFPVLASHTSKPLSELIEWANKESDNFYTEMLLKTLSAETRGIPGTFENGIKEVKSFLAEQNVDTNLVKMNDGSGLATGNFTTTENLSNYLFSMKSHSESDIFISSLPVAGIDGSIAHRFKGTPLYNNLKAKTGYVGGSRTLSGYFESASGRSLTFSIATNHFAGKVRPVDNFHQQILEFLYQKY